MPRPLNNLQDLAQATTPNAIRESSNGELDAAYNHAHSLLRVENDGTQRQVAASMNAILREIDRRDQRSRHRWTIFLAMVAGASFVLSCFLTWYNVSVISQLRRDVEGLKHPVKDSIVHSEPTPAQPAKQGTQP